jgi:4-hydroxybenzoate polyprenyltransferase
MQIEPHPPEPEVVREGPRPGAPLAWSLVRALRPHQWAKNLLIVVPALAAHRLQQPSVVGAVLRAFVAYGLVASAVYVLNDLADLASDRRHPRKRMRPFASGALPVWVGLVLAPVLLVAAAVLGASLPWSFLALLAGYLAANVVYSFELKTWPIADVLLLAGLYTARVFAGGLATGIPVSEWLATFAMFLFLSLAFLKRASELVERGEAVGRGYAPGDRDVIFAMGTSAGYLSVLVLALYISSDTVRRLYATPHWLWGLCPVVLYWVSIMWLRARRGEVREDPLLFALADRTTWLLGAAGAAVIWMAS